MTEVSLQILRLTPEDIRKQAFLFNEMDFGAELLVIEEDRSANRHTGGTLAKRTELRDAICEQLVEGVSVRQVCRKFGVGRNTVSKLVDRLERDGKMEPYKKRVSKRMGQIVESGTELLLEKLEDGTVPVSMLPVMVGIISDKKALIDGEPSMRVEVNVNQALTQQAYDEWLDALPKVRTIDAESTVTKGKP